MPPAENNAEVVGVPGKKHLWFESVSISRVEQLLHTFIEQRAGIL